MMKLNSDISATAQLYVCMSLKPQTLNAQQWHWQWHWRFILSSERVFCIIQGDCHLVLQFCTASIHNMQKLQKHDRKKRQKTDKHGRKMYRNRTFWDCSAISISKFLPAKWNAMIDVKFNIHSVSVFKKRICDTLPTMKMISHLDKIKNKRQATLVLINPAFSAAALFAQITLCLQTEPEL